MKLMFASDIHGSAYYCRKMLEAFQEEKWQSVWFCLEIFYTTDRAMTCRRNMRPKEVIALLNPMKDKIYAVRGNCEAEVDQMVLNFPVMADYCVILADGKAIYATHGHIYNENNLPPLSEGDVLIHGHTHVLKAERREGYTLLNPGSVSIPKEGNIPTYAILEDGIFIIKGFEGEIVKTLDLNEKGTEKA